MLSQENFLLTNEREYDKYDTCTSITVFAGNKQYLQCNIDFLQL